MAAGGYVHVPLNPTGAHGVAYGRNTACVRDPYYHLSKDRTFVTYPDVQDTADRLRAIRSVAEEVKKMKTTWPLYPNPGAVAAKPYTSSSSNVAFASATPGVVMQPHPYPHPSMAAVRNAPYGMQAPQHTLGYAQQPHGPAGAMQHQQHHVMVHPGGAYPMQQPPQGTTWLASRRMEADDPERSLTFWEGSRHSAVARVAAANDKTEARVAAALPDRVHSSMWHSRPEPEGAQPAAQPEGAAAVGEREREPEPEAEQTAAAAAGVPPAPAGPPVFSAAVSHAAAMYRSEHERHALAVPHVRLLSPLRTNAASFRALRSLCVADRSFAHDRRCTGRQHFQHPPGSTCISRTTIRRPIMPLYMVLATTGCHTCQRCFSITALRRWLTWERTPRCTRRSLTRRTPRTPVPSVFSSHRSEDEA